jgi:hypothetical protein
MRGKLLVGLCGAANSQFPRRDPSRLRPIVGYGAAGGCALDDGLVSTKAASGNYRIL